MKLSQLAEIIHGQLIGRDTEFHSVSIDSRAVKKGDCFFAIKGDFFDGHDFIPTVIEKNASCVIVETPFMASQTVTSDDIAFIQVHNTRQALKDLAAFYRKNTAIPVFAITGSCGKTTTRALLENILKQQGNVLASKKSFNNDIGLPLTLLQLKPTHDFLVLEIGTNHPGEIAALTKIAKPTVATVTMAAAVHIEHFKSVKGIAQEKGDIFNYLTGDGVAVINNDDEFASLWHDIADQRQVITFGISAKSDVMAHNIISNQNGQTHFVLEIAGNKIDIQLPLLGEHNVVNALAAAAMAFTTHISLEKIKIGLETVEPEYGRLVEKKAYNGAIILDDSYNANPTSVKAAITLLAHRSQKNILVLGDMGELGNIAEKMHTEIGLFAKNAGILQLLCYGKNMKLAANAFGEHAQHFDDYDSLIAALKKQLTQDTTVLIKGSRSMKMEKVVEALVGEK